MLKLNINYKPTYFSYINIRLWKLNDIKYKYHNSSKYKHGGVQVLTFDMQDKAFVHDIRYNARLSKFNQLTV